MTLQLGYVSPSPIMPPIYGGHFRMPPVEIEESKPAPKPDLGSETGYQTNFFGGYDPALLGMYAQASYGSSFNNIRPWLVWPGTPATYRAMLKHPTIALARAMVIGAIFGGKWTAEVEDGGTAEQKLLVEESFVKQRQRHLADILRGPDFGWAPFEIVWKMDDGKMVIDYLKPLLPDDFYTQALIYKDGRFAGVQNDGEKFLVKDGKGWAYTYNGAFGNPYGEAKLENVRKDWSRSEMLDDDAMKTGKKISGVIPIITHPPGTWTDGNNVKRSYRELAVICLNSLMSGQGVAMETIGATAREILNNPDAAKAAMVNIDFYDAGTISDSLGGFSDRQRYYDSRMFRGMLVPERAGLEGQYGTKAEAGEHGSFLITHAQHLDADICDQLSRGPVDALLRINGGDNAIGKVKLKSAPLTDANKVIDELVMNAIVKNPSLFEEFLTQIDADAIVKRRGVPVPEGGKVDFTMSVENQTQRGNVPPGTGEEDEDDPELQRSGNGNGNGRIV